MTNQYHFVIALTHYAKHGSIDYVIYDQTFGYTGDTPLSIHLHDDLPIMLDIAIALEKYSQCFSVYGYDTHLTLQISRNGKPAPDQPIMLGSSIMRHITEVATSMIKHLDTQSTPSRSSTPVTYIRSK